MATNADLDAVIRRYRRGTWLARLVLFLELAAVLVVAVLRLSLVGLLVVGLGLLVAIRVPLFVTGGTATLATDADPETVRAAFAGERPPPLVYQWAVADAVRPTEDGAAYDLDSLLGLRSVTMTVEPTETDDGVTLRVSLAGTEWARYDVTVEPAPEGGTRVTVASTAERRFALRRLPDWVVGTRYRDAALEAQGYAVRDRSQSLSLSQG